MWHETVQKAQAMFVNHRDVDKGPPEGDPAMVTVLIVDDEFVIAEILSFALQEEGVTTIIAGNGFTALEILDGEWPDLIITDFMMPGMNGIEMAEAIRTSKAHGLTPMILMSGAQADLGLARPDLFVGVVEKPFDIDVIISKVKAIVGPTDDNATRQT